jgi:hypothetical protein
MLNYSRKNCGEVLRRAITKRVWIAGALAMCLIVAAVASEPFPRFARSYTVRGPAHLSVYNPNGDIFVNAWNRREITVRATPSPYSVITDRVIGSSISISVVRGPGYGTRVGRVDFEISAPPETSVSLKNTMKGRIYVTGLTGHVNVRTVDGDIHLVGLRSPSIEANVISGDIFFDGELTGSGPYNLQSMRGDIDISLPGSVPFDLYAKALTGKINLGDFLLSMFTQQPRFIAGAHDRGGPRLNLTTYDGHIMLHKR